MADNTIGWGQGSVNNTNDWGKGKANSTNDWGSIYANSPSGDTNIEGGSAVNPDAFIIQVQTDNTGTSADNQFTLPVSGAGTYDIKTPEHNLTNQAGRTILTFSSAGIYNIEIIGNTAPFQISNASYGDRLKVIDIINFGNIPFFDYRYAFRSFTNLTTLTATDSFDFSNVGTTQASLISAFQGCSNFVSGINGWNNFGIINNMSTMFRECRLFNDDITNWDVSNVTRMDLMFYGGNSFNQDIGNWDVSNVTNMNAMFGGFGQDMAFDQDISSWQISQVTNLNLFMNRVTLSTANYDALLIAWDSQGAMSYSGTVDFGSSTYTLGGAAEAARTSLISKWGGIIDGGGVLDTNTLIAYYNFNNNVLDQKNSYDGTWNGTSAYATGKSGQAISNNGNTSNYISIADADAFSFTNGTSDIPFSISFYHYSNSSSNQMLINKMGASSNREWYINSFSNQIKVRLYNSDGGTTNFIGKDFNHTRNNNTWYHYVLTYDGSETSSGLKMYIDGVLTFGSQNNGGTYTGMANLVQETVIGRFNDLTLLPLDGLIDGMGIWDKELSAGEVTEIYNTQNGGSEII